ncbi:uncharacterized protein TNIN_174901 [Trichonephila inaurata madagascariensis]|uniref:Uncharacterized protein n=1 Tax=Trichonephila inaurata madagascariensis TaxID=2747483 RepID=A0A8X7C3A9_9ARAC|nr:uncharacterized protein TNIN_174901 [Trichonephila inaurata madagascariensis]
MNMLEVADPKVCIIIDFRENGSFASQDLPFPSTALRLTPTEWLITQLNRHRKAFNWVKESQSAIEGLLLMNVERHTKFSRVFRMQFEEELVLENVSNCRLFFCFLVDGGRADESSCLVIMDVSSSVG